MILRLVLLAFTPGTFQNCFIYLCKLFHSNALVCSKMFSFSNRDFGIKVLYAHIIMQIIVARNIFYGKICNIKSRKRGPHNNSSEIREKSGFIDVIIRAAAGLLTHFNHWISYNGICLPAATTTARAVLL